MRNFVTIAILKMLYPIPSHLNESPFYKKAMEIIILSRRISAYFNQDLAALRPDGKENSHIYFSGDIVQQSVSLAPEIINAERERYRGRKQKHVASIQRLTKLLIANCKRLEQSNSNGKDFLPILRKELKKLKKLQRHWLLTL